MHTLKTLKDAFTSNLQRFVFRFFRCYKILPNYRYSTDGLYTVHESDFLKDPKFIASYARGVQAAGKDYEWYWRIHVGLWVAKEASMLDGDFVECGVFRGFLMSSICTHLNWNTLNKSAWLLDSYNGYDLSQLNENERLIGRELDNVKYAVDCYSEVVENFKEWERIHIIKGVIPQTLTEIKAERVCFLSIDMNNAAPEIAALRYIWPKLVPGAWILLDDYAGAGFNEQYKAMNQLATELGVSILSVPTGQGILRKPSK